VWITVKADGSIKREIEGGTDDTNRVEADGSFIRVGPDAEIIVSGDGSNLSRRTDERLDSITAEGIMSIPRNRPLRDGTGD